MYNYIYTYTFQLLCTELHVACTTKKVGQAWPRVFHFYVQGN